MATKQPVQSGIREVAISRVLDHIHRQHRNGRRVFRLRELANDTRLDPTTTAEVMRELEGTGPFDVKLLEGEELRWRIDGCVYELNGWKNQNWNLD